MLTDRDLEVLRALDRYYALSREQIQRLCFKTDLTGRVTRRRLQILVAQGLINRHRATVFYPSSSPPGSIYFPSRKGCEFLAEYLDDERRLLTPTQTPQPHQLLHWLAVSDTHIALDQAVATQQAIMVETWINEWDVCNKDESAPEKRYRLYTLLRESPRLIVAPDAAFLLSIRGFSKGFYLEQDRSTTGAYQLAARKSPGYAELATRNLQAKHFPQATVPGFSILLIAPDARRREALRKALREKARADLWKIAAMPDLTPEQFLHAPIFYPVVGEPSPLVKAE